jgi:hypothetical protein
MLSTYVQYRYQMFHVLQFVKGHVVSHRPSQNDDDSSDDVYHSGPDFSVLRYSPTISMMLNSESSASIVDSQLSNDDLMRHFVLSIIHASDPQTQSCFYCQRTQLRRAESVVMHTGINQQLLLFLRGDLTLYQLQFEDFGSPQHLLGIVNLSDLLSVNLNPHLNGRLITTDNEQLHRERLIAYVLPFVEAFHLQSRRFVAETSEIMDLEDITQEFQFLRGEVFSVDDLTSTRYCICTICYDALPVEDRLLLDVPLHHRAVELEYACDGVDVQCFKTYRCACKINVASTLQFRELGIKRRRRECTVPRCFRRFHHLSDSVHGQRPTKC